MNQLYFLDQDDEGHWYLVEANYRPEWKSWLYSDEYYDGVEPHYAKCLGGHPSDIEFYLAEMVDG